MKVSTLLSLSLLGLLLWASCTQANDDAGENKEETLTEEATVDSDDEESQEPPKEKTTDIEEEDNVMVLHINNFARALSENKFLLVEFYAPWCGHCRQLEPQYAEAAGKLKEEESAIRLAKVDAIEEKELGEEFEIGGFPTLKLFVDGDRKNAVEFNGKRSAEGIVQWLKRRSGPGAQELDSVAAAAQFIDSHNITVVGFFENLESDAAKLLREVYLEKADTEIAVTTTPEVFQKYEVKGNSVVLFKKFDEGRADLKLSEDQQWFKENITSFIGQSSLELIIPFSQESSQKIFTSGYLVHALVFFNSSVESQVAMVEESRSLAKKFKTKILFISIDVSQSFPNVLNYFGVSEDDAPTARIINMETGKKFNIATKKYTLESMSQLCQEVVDGTAQAYLKSEEVPEDWNKGPVTVLVGKNFESVALDPTKNVFVEFYAPWCGHCKELAPIWEQLGEKYADRDDIIIAKMDSIANELETVTVDAFPTIKYFPAGDKEVVDYTGKKDLETFSKFLDAGGVLPEEPADDDDDDDDDEAEEDKKDDSTGDDDKGTDEEAATNTSKDEL